MIIIAQKSRQRQVGLGGPSEGASSDGGGKKGTTDVNVLLSLSRSLAHAVVVPSSSWWYCRISCPFLAWKRGPEGRRRIRIMKATDWAGREEERKKEAKKPKRGSSTDGGF
jgi:hypothetical protein